MFPPATSRTICVLGSSLILSFKGKKENKALVSLEVNLVIKEDRAEAGVRQSWFNCGILLCELGLKHTRMRLEISSKLSVGSLEKST